MRLLQGRLFPLHSCGSGSQWLYFIQACGGVCGAGLPSAGVPGAGDRNRELHDPSELLSNSVRDPHNH